MANNYVHQNGERGHNYNHDFGESRVHTAFPVLICYKFVADRNRTMAFEHSETVGRLCFFFHLRPPCPHKSRRPEAVRTVIDR